MSVLRKNVKNLDISFSKAYSKYTQIIAYLLLTISDISDMVEDEKLQDEIYTYSTLSMYKESIGQKRAALSSLFSQKEFSKEIYEYFLTADTQEKIYLKSFLHSTDEETQKFYFKTLANSVLTKVQSDEEVALRKLQGENVNVNPEIWFENVTEKIDLIKIVEQKVFNGILKLVEKLNNTSNIFLTKEEKKWIKSHVVTVGVEQWNPVVFSNDGSDIDGISGEYLKTIIKKTGLKIEVVNDVWKKLLNDFNNKKIDLLPATYYTSQRDKYGLYSSSYFKMKDYIYVKETNKDIKSLEDLNGKRLAIENSYGTIEKIRTKFPNIELVFTKNLDDSINKVLNGEVDALYEGQIVVEKKIEEELISGLKGIAQNSFSAPTLHFFSQLDEPILASILQKGLNSISTEERKTFQLKWFSKSFSKKNNKELNIAFHFDRPPFMFGKTSSKGIEVDLVKEILESQGYEINIHQMAISNMKKILETNSNFDAVSAISKNNDKMFYSDHFIAYENYVITRKNENIKINNLEDLSKVSFVSWSGSYNDLGDKFYDYFNPTDGKFKSSYRDTTSQKDQHKLFFDKKVDAIVVDKTIFKWYKLALKNNDKYTFHKIFPNLTTFPVKFRSNALKETFNKGLKEMKKSGRYDEIIDFYLKQDIRPLLRYSNLVADISGRFIFTDKPQELSNILKEFFIHPDIMHIQVFDITTNATFVSLQKKNGIVIENDDKKEYQKLPNIKKGIYFANKGNPLEVGKIEIYYKKDFENKNGELIPSLTNFTDIKAINFKKIKRSYEKFNLDIKTVLLTKDEKEWIKLHPVIKFTGDPDWLPFEAFNAKSEYIGIVSEYLK